MFEWFCALVLKLSKSRNHALNALLCTSRSVSVYYPHTRAHCTLRNLSADFHVTQRAQPTEAQLKIEKKGNQPGIQKRTEAQDSRRGEGGYFLLSFFCVAISHFVLGTYKLYTWYNKIKLCSLPTLSLRRWRCWVLWLSRLWANKVSAVGKIELSDLVEETLP